MHYNQKLIFTLIFLYFVEIETKSEKTYKVEEKKYFSFNTTYYYYDSLIFSMTNTNLNKKYDIISLELKYDLKFQAYITSNTISNKKEISFCKNENIYYFVIDIEDSTQYHLFIEFFKSDHNSGVLKRFLTECPLECNCELEKDDDEEDKKGNKIFLIIFILLFSVFIIYIYYILVICFCKRCCGKCEDAKYCCCITKECESNKNKKNLTRVSSYNISTSQSNVKKNENNNKIDAENERFKKHLEEELRNNGIKIKTIDIKTRIKKVEY